MDGRSGAKMERDGSHRTERVGRWLGGWLGSPSCLAVHLGLFLLGATLLTLLNLLRSPEEIWFWRPLVWWGVLLAAHAGLTVGGVLRGAGASSPAPQARRTEEPRRGNAGRGARALGGVAARVGVVATARVGDAAVAAARRVRGHARGAAAGPTGDPADGWSAEDDAAFASWAQATNSWSAPPPEAAAPSKRRDGWHPPSSAGASPDPNPDRETEALASWARPSSNGVHAGRGRVAASPDGLPTSSGRFRSDDPNAPRPASPAENGSVTGEWVPAAVAALWGTTPTPQHATTTEAMPAAAPRPADPALDGGPPSPTNRRRADQTGRDVVLNGPVPVDPHDPQWTRLEAAAEAWLARRGSGSAPTPLSPSPASTGTEGATTPHA